MKNKNSIIILNLLSTVVIQGLAFISSPIFSRMLGTENFGIVSVYHTWTMVISAVFSLQVGGSLSIARAKFDEEKQPEFQSSILSLGTLSYLGFSLLLFIFLNQVARFIKLDKMLIIAMVLQSYGQFCVSFLNSKFTFEFKAVQNFILSAVTAVISVGLSIILVFVIPAEVNYWGRVLGMTIAYLMLGAVAWVILLPKGKRIYSSEYWRFGLRLGIPLIFHALSGLILSQIDRVMLQHMCTSSMVGIYSLAYTFGTILNVIWNALNNSWVPFYFEHTRQGQIDILRKRAHNYLELFTVLACGFVLLTTEVYHIFASRDYWEGTNVVIMFAVGYYMVFLYSFPVNYEFYHQKNTIVATITVLAAVCNIVLNYFFIQSMNYVGAAIATMIAHTLQFAFHYVGAKYILGRKDFPFSMRMFMPYIVAFLLVALVTVYTPNLWLLRWGVGALIGVWELHRIWKRKSIF